MRYITDRKAFDKFVKAVKAFPPTARDGRTAQQVFKESYQILDGLAAGADFPRAMAWKAYALALSAYEGWRLPNTAPVSRNDKLDTALELAKKAITLDETDYDLHWALADIYLIKRNFKKAVHEFETAIYYNGDGRNPSLFIEAGSAMMQAGELEKAQLYFRKSRAPDWHHWMRGIYLFLKAGRAKTEGETFLNLALDELRNTRAGYGEDYYQTEIQLIYAAVYWRRWKLLSDAASKMSDPEIRIPLEQLADRSWIAAKRAMERFTANLPHFSRKQALTALPLGNVEDRQYWEETVAELWRLPDAKKPPKGNKGPKSPATKFRATKSRVTKSPPTKSPPTKSPPTKSPPTKSK